MEPVVTLQQLRRAIARELEMPFFQRYKAGFLVVDSGTTNSLIDADLTQKNKFWNGAWVYRIASQEASQITDFNVTDNKLVLEVPITTFAAADEYEIHSIWNAYDIQDAINSAIRDSRRIFIETLTYENIIVESNKLAYDISLLAPFLIHKVWLEQPSAAKRGQLVSATLTTFVVENSGILLGVNSDWKVSIYEGTGSGQIRNVESVASATGVVDDWVTVPDSTSKYALWNPTEQTNDWYPWSALRYDSTKEFPDLLYFSRRPTDFNGLRIRIEYSGYPSELSAENGTTLIPESYLIPAAVSKLHSRKVKDTKVDRELHFAESKRYMEMAESWLVRNAPHRPDSNILDQHSGSYQPDSMNPLNWR